MTARERSFRPRPTKPPALIAYLHRSRDELETLKGEAMRAAQDFAEEKRRLQTEWTDRQRTRLKELEQQFAADHRKTRKGSRARYRER